MSQQRKLRFLKIPLRKSSLPARCRYLTWVGASSPLPSQDLPTSRMSVRSGAPARPCSGAQLAAL
jgi:hypothetical protein